MFGGETVNHQPAHDSKICNSHRSSQNLVHKIAEHQLLAQFISKVPCSIPHFCHVPSVVLDVSPSSMSAISQDHSACFCDVPNKFPKLFHHFSIIFQHFPTFSNIFLCLFRISEPEPPALPSSPAAPGWEPWR